MRHSPVFPPFYIPSAPAGSKLGDTGTGERGSQKYAGKSLPCRPQSDSFNMSLEPSDLFRLFKWMNSFYPQNNKRQQFPFYICENQSFESLRNLLKIPELNDSIYNSIKRNRIVRNEFKQGDERTYTQKTANTVERN